MINRPSIRLASGLLAALVAASSPVHPESAQATRRGTIKGHVRLIGELPGNPVIRMRRDRMCAKITAGKQMVQGTVLAALNGDLANVFVRLEGSFPPSRAPAAPVTIEQRGCVYGPRVVGLQAGQPLDPEHATISSHSIRGSSTLKDNSFNVARPIKGMVNRFNLKDDGTVVQLACDVHAWMTAYRRRRQPSLFRHLQPGRSVTIANVPPGTCSIKAWHEQYGWTTQSVRVAAGQASSVESSSPAIPGPPRRSRAASAATSITPPVRLKIGRRVHAIGRRPPHPSWRRRGPGGQGAACRAHRTAWPSTWSGTELRALFRQTFPASRTRWSR